MVEKSSSGYDPMRGFKALPVSRTPWTPRPGPASRASPPTSIPFRLRFSPIEPSGSIGRQTPVYPAFLQRKPFHPVGPRFSPIKSSGSIGRENSGLSCVFARENAAARGRT